MSVCSMSSDEYSNNSRYALSPEHSVDCCDVSQPRMYPRTERRRHSLLSRSSLPGLFQQTLRQSTVNDLHCILQRKIHRAALVRAVQQHHKVITTIGKQETSWESQDTSGLKSIGMGKRLQQRRNAMTPDQVLEIKRANRSFYLAAKSQTDEGPQRYRGKSSSHCSTEHTCESDRSTVDVSYLLMSSNFPTFACSEEMLLGATVHMILDVAPELGEEPLATSHVVDLVTNIRSMYHDVPYHRFVHAFDVTQMMYMLMNKYLVDHQDFQDSVSKFSLILAALSHDVGHPGMDNKALRDSNDPLCAKFGLNSTLEKMHSSRILTLLNNHPVLLFFTSAQRKTIWKLLPELIIATDMERHEMITRDFQEASLRYILEGTTLPSSLVYCVLLKVCDISNVCRPFATATRWTHMLEDEQTHRMLYENQGSRSPLQLGSRSLSYGGVINFIRHSVQPLLSIAREIDSDMANNLLAQALSNLKQWEAIDVLFSQQMAFADQSVQSNNYSRQYRCRRNGVVLPERYSSASAPTRMMRSDARETLNLDCEEQKSNDATMSLPLGFHETSNEYPSETRETMQPTCAS